GSRIAAPQAPSPNNDPFDPANRVRDLLGTTHHEAGTLWMGASASDSVTDLDGRFHHVTNAYVAGPALFPTLGSANPSLTALALARRSAGAIVRRSFGAEPGFAPLGTGRLHGRTGSRAVAQLRNRSQRLNDHRPSRRPASQPTPERQPFTEGLHRTAESPSRFPRAVCTVAY